MSTESHRQRDTTQVYIAGDSLTIGDDVYGEYRRRKEECRQRMDQTELTNEQFLQVLLDVHALHLDLGGGGS